MASYTGNGVTFALSTGTVARVIRIQGFTESIDVIDDNGLDTTGHDEHLPGDLIHHDELTLDVVVDPDVLTTFAGAVVTGTLTFNTGQGTEPTLAGTGFFTSRSFGSVENNERIEGTVTWKFDGKTGPTFTAGGS